MKDERGKRFKIAGRSKISVFNAHANKTHSMAKTLLQLQKNMHWKRLAASSMIHDQFINIERNVLVFFNPIILCFVIGGYFSKYICF